MTHERTAKMEDDKSSYEYEKQVFDTRMAFIKYCVQLFKDKVEPMLIKLKRTDLTGTIGDDKSTSPFDKMKKSTFATNLRS